MSKFHITINRQFGSLGRPIGMKLAQLLGIEFYDRDIVEEAAKELQIPLSVASALDEREQGVFTFMKYPLGDGNSKEIKEKLYAMQNKIIMKWAEENSCVVVGRCADYLLRNKANQFSIFIYAPIEARLRNCVEELGMKETEALKMMNQIDKARYAYHKRYTRFTQKDIESNQIMIDSSLLGVNDTAEMLAQIARKKFKL
ncbi:cytidylate kinase-like family protein [Lachnospiraceae bacterium ZAX-1]